MVRQAQRGEEPSSGRLSNRFTSHGGPMQHVSSDVLQKLQQQGEGQEEEGVARGQKNGRRDPAGDGRPSETSQTSLLLASEDSAHSTTSPSSSHLSEAAGYARLSRPEVQRRGSGRRSETRSDSQAPFALSPPVGPTARSRTTTAPSWPCAASTIPSQLLGRGVGTHADLLNLEAAHEADTAETDITPKPASAFEHARLSPHWTARPETDSSSMKAASKHSSPSKTPRSGRSIASISSPSFSSGKSDASSFAYLVRDRRADRRLLQKKSQPIQHRKKRPSLIKRPSSTRSATIRKSKIVEDSLLPAQCPSRLSNTVSTSKSPPAVLSSPSLRSVVRIDRSSQSQSRSESSKEQSLSPPRGVARHSRSRSPPAHINLPPLPRYARFESQLESQSRGGDPSQDRRLSTQVPPSPRSMPSRRTRRPTPPEVEPRTPFDRTPRHGDHYFRIFDPETIYEKMFAEGGPHKHSTSAERVEPREPDPISPLPAQTPMDNATPIKRSHLRNSILSIFHTTPRSDSKADGADYGVSRMSSPVQAPSDVKFGTPLASKSSRNSSHDFFASYFPIHRRHNKSSENTPGAAAFALSTNWEDVVAESQTLRHVKQDSTPMSPLSMPQHPIRPRPKRMDERMNVTQAAQQLPPDTVDPTLPSGTMAASKPKYNSAGGEEQFRHSRTDPRVPSWLPSEMRRVNTPPIEKVDLATNKSGRFKSFFFDMKSIPAEQTSTESDSPEPSRIRRRKPIIPKPSLQSLLPKLSLNRLKRKATFTTEEQKQAEDPLKVTGFQQTPFSQRYGDTRRTKMNRIRSYLDETLKMSDDDDETAVFAFDAPDHLPNSPLCPLSPKHRSGGRAICPIHSRKKTLVGQASGIAMQKPGKPSPRIVFESNNQAEGHSKCDMEDLRGG